MGQNFCTNICNKTHTIETLNGENQLNFDYPYTLSKKNNKTPSYITDETAFHLSVDFNSKNLEVETNYGTTSVDEIIKQFSSYNKNNQIEKEHSELEIEPKSIFDTVSYGFCKFSHDLEIREDRTTFQCDMCYKSWLPKSYCCLICNFDLCEKCHLKNKLQNESQFFNPANKNIENVEKLYSSFINSGREEVEKTSSLTGTKLQNVANIVIEDSDVVKQTSIISKNSQISVISKNSSGDNNNADKDDDNDGKVTVVLIEKAKSKHVRFDDGKNTIINEVINPAKAILRKDEPKVVPNEVNSNSTKEIPKVPNVPANRRLSVPITFVSDSNMRVERKISNLAVIEDEQEGKEGGKLMVII